MINNLLVLSIQPSGNNPNPNPNSSFIELVKVLVDKANLTKGQFFYLIMTGFLLIFVLLATASPAIVSVAVAVTGGSLTDIQPVIPVKHLLLGLGIWLGLGVFYFIAYSIPEIRDRWNTRRKNNN